MYFTVHPTISSLYGKEELLELYQIEDLCANFEDTHSYYELWDMRTIFERDVPLGAIHYQTGLTICEELDYVKIMADVRANLYDGCERAAVGDALGWAQQHHILKDALRSVWGRHLGSFWHERERDPKEKRRLYLRYLVSQMLFGCAWASIAPSADNCAQRVGYVREHGLPVDIAYAIRPYSKLWSKDYNLFYDLIARIHRSPALDIEEYIETGSVRQHSSAKSNGSAAGGYYYGD